MNSSHEQDCSIVFTGAPRFDDHNNILRSLQFVNIFFMRFCQCFFLPLRCRYPAYNPVLTHRQPKLLLQGETRCFTPIQHDRQQKFNLFCKVSCIVSSLLNAASNTCCPLGHIACGAKLGDPSCKPVDKVAMLRP